MSTTALIARHEWRRLAVQPFAWLLAALVVALMAWQYLLALEAFLQLAPKLGGIKDAPGVTDLVAIPLLRSFSNLLMLIVPLVTMRYAPSVEARIQQVARIAGAPVSPAGQHWFWEADGDHVSYRDAAGRVQTPSSLAPGGS